MVDQSMEKWMNESASSLVSTTNESASSLISTGRADEKTDGIVHTVTRSTGFNTLKPTLHNDHDSTAPPLLPLSPSASGTRMDSDPIADSDENPSTPRQMRSVSFEGLDSPPSSSNLSAGEASVHDMMARIATLNDRLAQASVDLSGEKVLRKNKEKNLLKLAKELNRRASDSQIKDMKIVELEETVSEMQAKLQTADDDVRASQREVNEVQEKYRSVCRDYDVHLAESRMQHEAKCSELHHMALKANTEAERLRARLVAFESRLQITEGKFPSDNSRRTSTDKMEKRILRASLAVTLAFNLARYLHLTSMDSICGPAQPGTIFGKDQAVTMEAPWWAPNRVKEQAFMICGDRTRTRLVWSEGKLSQYSLEAGAGGTKGNTTPSRRSRGFSIRTGENKVFLQNRKGWVIKEIDLN